jgi:hypothetical protein
VDKLHGKIRLRPEAGIRCACFVDLRNAGVLEAAERLRFLFESPEKIDAGKARLDDLQCNGAPWIVLLGFVYGPHPSFAEEAEDPIASQGAGNPRRITRAGFHRHGRPAQTIRSCFAGPIQQGLNLAPKVGVVLASFG